MTSSLVMDRVHGGYLLHGMTSVGPVHAMGMTEAMALAKAKEQIRQLREQHIEQKFNEFREGYPDYYWQEIAL